MSDSALKEALTRLGEKVGPITDSSRSLYQSRLVRALKDAPELDDSVTESSVLAPQTPEPPKRSTKERDGEFLRINHYRVIGETETLEV